MLEGEVTSREMRVTLGNFSRSAIFDLVRAVAKTWRPCCWNAMARAEPMPPALQPVMRTDLGVIGLESGERGGI